MFHNVVHHFDKHTVVIKCSRSEIRSGVQPASNDSIMGPADWRFVTSCTLDIARTIEGCRVTLKGDRRGGEIGRRGNRKLFCLIKTRS